MDTTNIILVIGFFSVAAVILIVGQGVDKANQNLESIKRFMEFYGDKNGRQPANNLQNRQKPRGARAN